MLGSSEHLIFLIDIEFMLFREKKIRSLFFSILRVY